MIDDTIRLPSAEYILSQDIGKKQDDTTSLIYRITPEYVDSYDGGRRVMTFMDVVYMDKRRLSYDRLARFTQELMQSASLGERSTLLIDGTGIGEAVYDIYTSKGLEPVKIIFTGGETASIERGRLEASKRFNDISGYKVPKVDMVSAAQVIFQQGRIRFASDLPFRDECLEQLQAFVGKVNEKTENVKYENLTDEIHDDFVVNILMASWYAIHMDAETYIEPESPSYGLGSVMQYSRSSSYDTDPFSDL